VLSSQTIIKYAFELEKQSTPNVQGEAAGEAEGKDLPLELGARLVRCWSLAEYEEEEERSL
jgi:hypothetical protein